MHDIIYVIYVTVLNIYVFIYDIIYVLYIIVLNKRAVIFRQVVRKFSEYPGL